MPSCRSAIASLAISAIAPFVIAGCGKIAGIDAYQTCAAQGSEGNCQPARLTFSDQACEACVTDGCRDERAACESEPACLDFAACTYGCGKGDDGTCVHDCLQRASVTTAAMRQFFGCTSRCDAQCFSCGAMFAGAGRECGACAVADRGVGGLCELMNTCLEGACAELLACLRAECSRLWGLDPACRMVCTSRYPEASEQFFEIGNRVFTGCLTECNAGKQWACRHNPVAWPNESGATAVVTLNTRPAVHVRACKNIDFDCDGVMAEGDTDPNGRIRFELPQVPTPAQGYYFEIDDPSDGIGTTLFSPWVPLVNDLALWVPGQLFGELGREALTSLAVSRGVTLDLENKGSVIAQVFDCFGGLADSQWLSPEISMSATPGGSPPFYGYPLSSSRLGGGAAFFINLTPNQTSIDVFRAGELIATATVPVRAGAGTWLDFNYRMFSR